MNAATSLTERTMHKLIAIAIAIAIAAAFVAAPAIAKSQKDAALAECERVYKSARAELPNKRKSETKACQTAATEPKLARNCEKTAKEHQSAAEKTLAAERDACKTAAKAAAKEAAKQPPK